MPTDTAALLLAADACERAGAAEEIQAIRNAVDAVLPRNGNDWEAAIDILGRVQRGELRSSCLLGAAMMLEREGWTWEGGRDPYGQSWARAFPLRETDLRDRAAGTGNRDAATVALALTAAWLRAHRAAAAGSPAHPKE